MKELSKNAKSAIIISTIFVLAIVFLSFFAIGRSNKAIEAFEMSETIRPKFGTASVSIIPKGEENPKVFFEVEVAKTPEERSYGLSFVKSLPEHKGMIFLYNIPNKASFWMKNTFIPLDIIFVDENMEITQIKRSAKPHDESIVTSEKNIVAVLEINARLARKLGIKSGDKVVIDYNK